MLLHDAVVNQLSETFKAHQNSNVVSFFTYFNPSKGSVLSFFIVKK